MTADRGTVVAKAAGWWPGWVVGSVGSMAMGA